MQVVTASDVKNRLGDLFDAVEQDEAASVLIERNRRPVALLLNARIAEKVILGAYAQGVLPRSIAMEQLGLDWYGDLLQRMNVHGIPRPMVSAEDAARMQAAAHEVLSELGPEAGSPAHRKGPKAP
ncbi:MAG: type II toxin-antitoxin system Phd/YefM family antitoxin [Proteobacteria bacterium]|nr:type II toxin-antitoxin system Phd/YefM family antitoxin [Pseudomonadota bacterium]